MKRQKYLFILFVLMLSANMLLIGCGVVENEDGSKKISLNPFVAEKIEKGGEAAVGVSEIVAPFLGPAGGVVAGGLAGALALFKKYKPKLVETQTQAEMSTTVAEITVDIFETLKKEHPKVWAECSTKINSQLQDAKIDTKVLENFIRGLRGLPPKS